MKLKGIVRGQVIELPQGTALPDGTEVTIDLTPMVQPIDVQERLAKIQELFGCWRDQPDLMEIFAEIDRDRHADLGRAITSTSPRPYGLCAGEFTVPDFDAPLPDDILQAFENPEFRAFAARGDRARGLALLDQLDSADNPY